MSRRFLMLWAALPVCRFDGDASRLARPTKQKKPHSGGWSVKKEVEVFFAKQTKKPHANGMSVQDEDLTRSAICRFRQEQCASG